MKRTTRACGITSKTRNIVYERDGGRCVICGSYQNLQTAHFIPRSLLGLGIPQNLVMLCMRCHFEYDNGAYRKELYAQIRGYLKAQYSDWDERTLTYKKYGGKNG